MFGEEERRSMVAKDCLTKINRSNRGSARRPGASAPVLAVTSVPTSPCTIYNVIEDIVVRDVLSLASIKNVDHTLLSKNE